jgi:hypothetical protein
MLYKLTLRIALTNVAIISRLIKGNEYENYMLISLVNVKHELRRQLNNAKNTYHRKEESPTQSNLGMG